MMRIAVVVCLLGLAVGCGSDKTSSGADDEAAQKSAAAAKLNPRGCRNLQHHARDIAMMMNIVKTLDVMEKPESMLGPVGTEKYLRKLQGEIEAVAGIPGSDDIQAQLREIDDLIDRYLAAAPGERGELREGIMARAAAFSPTALPAALVEAGCK